MAAEKMSSDSYEDLKVGRAPPRGALRYCHVCICVGGMLATLIIGVLLGIGIGYWAIRPPPGKGKASIISTLAKYCKFPLPFSNLSFSS